MRASQGVCLECHGYPDAANAALRKETLASSRANATPRDGLRIFSSLRNAGTDGRRDSSAHESILKRGSKAS